MTDPNLSEPIPENNPDDEILTAFLDGELPEAEKAETEARLEAEPQFRARLEKLRAAGHFLDLLETLQGSRDITGNTMEILTGVVQKEIHDTRRRHRRLILLFFPILLLGAVVLFFLADLGVQFYLKRYSPDDRDYPVYSHLDALKAVQSLAFLKRLNEIPYFSRNADFTGAPSPGTEGPSADGPEPASGFSDGDDSGPSGEPDRSRQGPPEERFTVPPGGAPFRPRYENQIFAPFEIVLQKAEYNSLAETERKKYRELYNSIAADPESPVLEKTLVRFGNWFWNGLSETDRGQFWAEPEESRLELVQKFLSEGRGRLPSFPPRYAPGRDFHPGGPSGFPAPPPWASHRRINWKNALPEQLRRENLDVREEFHAFLKERAEEEPEQRPGGYRRFRERVDQFVAEKGIGFFTARLTEEGKEYIESQSEEEQSRLIGLLIQISLVSGRGEGRHVPPPQPRGGEMSFPGTESTADLAETLQTLPEKTREELLSLPADEMYSRLLLLHRGGGEPPVRHRPSAPPSRHGENDR